MAAVHGRLHRVGFSKYDKPERCDLDIIYHTYPAFIFGNACQSTDWPGWKSQSGLVK